MTKFNINTEVLFSHIKAHTANINKARFVPGSNNSKIMTASADDTLRVWDINGEELKLFGAHFDSVVDFDFHKEDRFILASASDDRTVLVWDYESAEVIFSLIDAKNSISCVRFTQEHLLTGSKDRRLRIYSLSTRKLVNVLEIGAVTSLAVHPSENYCYCGTTANAIFVINYISGAIINKVRAHDLPIKALDIDHTGKFLASSSLGKEVKIWDLTNATEFVELREFEAHKSPVTAVKFHPRDESIATGSFDRSVRIFRPEAKKPLIIRGPKLAISSLDWKNDGSAILFSSADGSFRIQNPSEKNPDLEIKRSQNYISSMFVTNRTLICGYGTGSILFYSLKDLSIEKELLNVHNAPITSINIENYNLISVSGDKLVKTWNESTLENIAVGKGHTMGIKGVIAQNEFVVTISSDSNIKVWDVNSLECKKTVKTHKFSVNSICLSNKRIYIATTSNDKQIIIHDLELNPLFTYNGHRHSVTAVCFSQSDYWLFSGSQAGEILVFNVQNQEIISRLDIHTGPILKMEFSADFHFLCVISADHNISIFSYEEKEEYFNLKNIYYNSFVGEPVDFCWIPNENSSSTKLLLSTILGELFEITIDLASPMRKDILERKIGESETLEGTSTKKKASKKVSKKKASKKPTKKKASKKVSKKKASKKPTKKKASKQVSKKKASKKLTKKTSKKKVSKKKASKKPSKKKTSKKNVSSKKVT